MHQPLMAVRHPMLQCNWVQSQGMHILASVMFVTGHFEQAQQVERVALHN
jgi:hypothetical protein